MPWLLRCGCEARIRSVNLAFFQIESKGQPHQEGAFMGVFGACESCATGCATHFMQNQTKSPAMALGMHSETYEKGITVLRCWPPSNSAERLSLFRCQLHGMGAPRGARKLCRLGF